MSRDAIPMTWTVSKKTPRICVQESRGCRILGEDRVAT